MNPMEDTRCIVMHKTFERRLPSLSASLVALPSCAHAAGKQLQAVACKQRVVYEKQLILLRTDFHVCKIRTNLRRVTSAFVSRSRFEDLIQEFSSRVHL